MPVEVQEVSEEDEGLPRNPDLRVAQSRFFLGLNEHQNDPDTRAQILADIREHG